MIEQGYEPDQALADKLYTDAKEELKTTEYYIKVESERQTSELLN
jgi:hypothetical protein